MRRKVIASLIFCLAVAGMARADGKIAAAREAAEFLLKKFGREVAEEGAEKLSGRIASAAARHGDEILAAVRKAGPKAMTFADEAGENAPQVVRLLAKHGDDAARVLSQPQGMALVTRFGDDAAEILIKHGSAVAQPILAAHGEAAMRALGAIGPQNARRLGMLEQSGELASIGRTEAVLEVIGRHGDRALQAVWNHKGSLAVGTVLAAFLADPEPFLDGTKDLAGMAAEYAVAPVAAASGRAIEKAGEAMAWPMATLLSLVTATGLGLAILPAAWRRFQGVRQGLATPQGSPPAGMEAGVTRNGATPDAAAALHER